MILSLVTKLLAGPLIGSIMGVIGKHYDVKQNQDVLKADLLKALMETTDEVAKTQARVIEAEINSESWLARNWRPMAACGFVFTLLFYALIVPCLVAWFQITPPRVGDTLLSWVHNASMVCLGGYVAGRSLEKVAETIAGIWKR